MKKIYIVGLAIAIFSVGALTGYLVKQDCKNVKIENSKDWEKVFEENTVSVSYNDNRFLFGKNGVISSVRIENEDGSAYIQRFFSDGRLKSTYLKKSNGEVHRIDFYKNCLFCKKTMWKSDVDGKIIEEKFFYKNQEEMDAETFSSKELDDE